MVSTIFDIYAPEFIRKARQSVKILKISKKSNNYVIPLNYVISLNYVIALYYVIVLSDGHLRTL